jgi:predicted RND superfamily exporter protein
MKYLKDWFARLIDRRSLAIVCVFLALAPLIGYGAMRALRNNTNDVTDWLPDTYPETADLRRYQEQFGTGSDNVVVVSWDGCTLHDQRLPLLAEKLRPPAQAAQADGAARRSPWRIDSVRTGPELLQQIVGIQMDLYDRLHPDADPAQRQLQLQRYEQEALQRLEGSLIGPNYLHGLTFDRHETRAVVRQVELGSAAEAAGIKHGDIVLQINGIPTPTHEAARAVLEQTYLQGTLAGRLSVQVEGRDEPYTWEWSGGPPSRQTGMFITLSAFGAQDRELENTLEMIRRIAVEQCAIPEPTLHLGGPPVDNVAIDVEGRRTLGIVVTLSLIMGFLACYWCFRNWKITLIVFFTALLSEATSLALVTLCGFNTNAVLLTMPTLVYVLTISAAIHIVNYYQDAIESGGLAGAAHRAVFKGALPCTLANATTAAGLVSLLSSELLPIRMFGGFSALAVVVSLLWVFFYLPAALQLWGYNPQEADALRHRKPNRLPAESFFKNVGEGILRRPVLVASVVMLLMIVTGAGVLRMKSSIDIMKLFDDDARLVQDYRWFESKLGPLVPMELVVAFDEQAIGTLREGGDDGQYREVSKLNLARRLKVVDQIRQAVVAELDEVSSSLSVATFAPDVERPEGFPGADYLWMRKLSQGLEQHRHEFEQAGYLAHHGGQELFRISLRLGAFDDTDYGAFVAHIREVIEGAQGVLATQVAGELSRARIDVASSIHVTYTGVVPIVYKAQRELLEGLKRSYVMAFGLISLMMIGMVAGVCGLLRAVPAGMIAMIPNVFPALMVFGFISWQGVAVDVGSMMTASVALGLAVDDTVHFLAWFGRAARLGWSRADATRNAYAHCARAMTQTSIVCGAGIAMHFFSTFTPTMQFGTFMLPLVFMALVGDLVLLPAILVSPLGWFFVRRGASGIPSIAEDAQEPQQRSLEAVVTARRRVDRPSVHAP